MSNNLMDYLKVRNEIQTGDPIQWQSRTIIGRTIQYFTGSKYNHTSIAIRFTEYDSDRVYVLEALDHGTVLRPLSARLKDHKGHAWILPMYPDFNPIRPNMGKWALEHVGIQYDYPSLFKQAICKVNADARRLFCSEYWWMAFKSSARLTHEGRQAIMQAEKILRNKAPRPADIPKLGIVKKPIKLL